MCGVGCGSRSSVAVLAWKVSCIYYVLKLNLGEQVSVLVYLYLHIYILIVLSKQAILLLVFNLQK